MTDPIDMALTEVTHQIPKEILYQAFNETGPSGYPLPVHEVIRQRVIIKRVLKECNVIGGKVKHIPLKHEYREDTSYYYYGYPTPSSGHSVFRIPDDERDGVEIIEVMSVQPPSHEGPEVTSFNGNNGGTVYSHARRVLNGYTGAEFTQTPMAELLAGDIIRLTPGTSDFLDWIASVRLAYDESFTNLNSSAVMSLCNLVVAATKSYIYNNLILSINYASNDAGMTIDNFREIVESYEPAEEEYQEKLMEFMGGARLDPARQKQIIKYIV